MARKGTVPSDDDLVIQLAAGATNVDAAKACGLSLRTVQRRLEDDTFRGRIQAARLAFTQRALDLLLSLRHKHVELIDGLATGDVKDAVRLGASKAILELGSKLRAEVEFEQRLQAIERRLAEAQIGGTP